MTTSTRQFQFRPVVQFVSAEEHVGTDAAGPSAFLDRLKTLAKRYILTIAFLSGVSLTSAAPLKASPAEEHKKLALLVGIDNYENVTDLDGCVNDVENMKSLLRDKFGFKERDILTLVDEQATRKAILDTFQRHLIAQAKQGDLVVFHYSGHGSQMKDSRVAGDEADQFDETIVPQDSRKQDVFDIPDDSINGLLRLLSEKTDNVTFIFDSCHSGTVARAAGKVRTVEKDERIPPPPDSFAAGPRGTAEGEHGWRPQDAKYVLLSGCRSNQLSYEYFAEGRANGAFTYFFAKEVRAAKGKLTYQDVMDKVVGNVNARFGSQEPQIEGSSKSNYVFSDETSLAENHVLVEPFGSDRVMLKAGSVQGLTVGSLYDVYAPGTKTFSPPAAPIVKIELTRVDAFRSEGKIAFGGPVQAASRAVERQHRYTDRKLFIRYEGLEGSETLKKIKGELDSMPFIDPVPEARAYDLLLAERNSNIVTEGSDPTEISPRVPVNTPDAVLRVVKQVSLWASWFNVLSIGNQTSSVDIDVRVERVAGQGMQSVLGDPKDAQADFKPGEILQVTVENKTDQDVFLAVLNLSTDGSIALVFPSAPGAQEILAKRGTWTKKLRTTLPSGRNEVKDFIKVFATSTPVDFSFLTQGAVRGHVPAQSNDPLSQLLAQAVQGVSRGLATVDLESWATAESVIRVRR
jgi:Caspase domain